jgi:hypothetical protein
MAEGRRYSDDEVRAILERALRQESASQGVAHDDLVAAASEIGVSRDDLERAAREITDTRGERDAKARILARRRAGFSAHLYAFLGVNAFLFALNWLTSPGVWWFLFPLLGWGLGLFFHARAAFSKEVGERAIARDISRADRVTRRSERKAAHEKRATDKNERKQRFEKGAADLGAAVEEGVGVLLSKVADEIRKKTEQATTQYAPRGDATAASKVRVDAPPERERGAEPRWNDEHDAEAEAEADQIRAEKKRYRS